MNVDTGEFRALQEQASGVAALGRKVSALTGRVSVMGSHLNRLDDLVEKDLDPMARLTLFVMENYLPRPREAARHAAPKRKRHLRAVGDDNT